MSFLENIDGANFPLHHSEIRRIPHHPREDRPSFPLEDTVEFSSAGRQLAETVGSSSFRAARIQAIRSEIAAGTYETRERIEGAVSRLLDILA